MADSGVASGGEPVGAYYSPTGRKNKPHGFEAGVELQEMLDGKRTYEGRRIPTLVMRCLSVAEDVQKILPRQYQLRATPYLKNLYQWVSDVEEMVGVEAGEFPRLLYLPPHLLEDFSTRLDSYFNATQVNDFYFQGRSEEVPIMTATPAGSFKWVDGDYPLVGNGLFAIMVGANGSGKSNFMAYLGLELADHIGQNERTGTYGHDITLITNLKYYRRIDQEYDNIIVRSKFSEVLADIATILMEDHTRRIVVMIDEMDSFMNAFDVMTQRKQTGYVHKVMWQMRKLNVTMFGNFKNVRDVGIRWRKGEDTTEGNVLCRLWKGGYPSYSTDSVEYFTNQQELHETIFLRFTRRKDILIDEIPDMRREYFHGQPTDLDWDVDVITMLAATRQITRPYSIEDVPNYYQNLGQLIFDNLETWTVGQDAALTFDDEDEQRKKLREEIEGDLRDEFQMEFILRKKDEGLKTKEIKKAVKDAFGFELAEGTIRNKICDYRKKMKGEEAEEEVTV